MFHCCVSSTCTHHVTWPLNTKCGHSRCRTTYTWTRREITRCRLESTCVLYARLTMKYMCIMYVWRRSCVYACMHVCMYVCMYVCIDACIALPGCDVVDINNLWAQRPCQSWCPSKMCHNLPVSVLKKQDINNSWNILTSYRYFVVFRQFFAYTKCNIYIDGLQS